MTELETDEAADALERFYAQSGPDQADSGGVSVTKASDVKPKNVVWLWDGRIAVGAVQLLVGQPGLGKTTAAAEVAARLSRGQLAGAFKDSPVSVLIASAEDSPAHTLVPRLMAAGADLERVGFVTVSRDGMDGSLVLPDDIQGLADHVRALEAKLLIIDPLVAHLPEKVNSHRDQDVRRVLAPLAAMGEALGIALLCVVHLNKAMGSNIVDRVGGSVGLTAAARNVLLIAEDPERPQGGRVFIHAKANLGPALPALRFHIEGRTVPSGDSEISTSGLVWDGEAAGLSTESVLNRDTEDERGQLAEAKAFLLEELASGPVPAQKVKEAAGREGHADRTLIRAKSALGVTSSKERGGKGSWLWELPQAKNSKDASDLLTQNIGTVGIVGTVGMDAKEAKVSKNSRQGEAGSLAPGSGAAGRFDAQVEQVLAAFPGSTVLPGQNDDDARTWGASA